MQLESTLSLYLLQRRYLKEGISACRIVLTFSRPPLGTSPYREYEMGRVQIHHKGFVAEELVANSRPKWPRLLDSLTGKDYSSDENERTARLIAIQ